MKRLALILSASAGQGHLRAADAVAEALRLQGTFDEVVHIDALQYCSPLFRHMYCQGYLDMVNNAPAFLGILYDHFDSPGKGEAGRLALEKINSLPLVGLIRKLDPAVIISTHFLPAELVAWMQRRGQVHCPQAVVVTDFDAHAMWLVPDVSMYFVALPETARHLVKLGVLPEAVRVTGIPISPRFAQSRASRSDMRLKLGLSCDLPTILISAGGFGVGRVQEITKMLEELETPCQIVVICGRNNRLKARIDSTSASAPSHVRLHTTGFVSNMEDYMAAADIMLGKPGGLTTSEALASGLAFVVASPIPGQEERNADHLLEEGAAIRCNNLPVLAYKVDQLLADPARLGRMQDSARRLGHPNAASDIAAWASLQTKNRRKATRRPVRTARKLSRSILVPFRAARRAHLSLENLAWYFAR